MKELLIEEMKRAIELLQRFEKPEDTYWYWSPDRAEIKRTLLQIRKHSILIEKEIDNK